MIGLLLLVCLPAQTGTWTVWTTHGSQAILEGSPPGKVVVARLQAARNEFEPFQIAIRADADALRNVIAQASDLNGPGGAVIPKTHLTFYREHFVYVRRPSQRSEAAPGLYPDALIPFIDPVTGTDIQPRRGDRAREGAKYDAVPFDVWPKSTAVLWIDVYVPPKTAPGTYRGSVTLRARERTDYVVPVELTVWDFELPAAPTVRSHFGSFGRIATAHNVQPGSPQFRTIERRYCAVMAQHRITPPVPYHLYPPATTDGSIDPAATHAELAQFMKEFRVNAFQVRWPPFKDPLGSDREKAKRYLATFADYLAQHGWLEGAYVYILDEPNDAEAYDQVRRRAALVKEADRRLRVLCTEQTKPSDPAWGDLNAAVDIWVPLWPLHDEKTALERLAEGDELWSYTALCQGPKPSPWWQIDMPLLNYRIPLWLNFRYQMTGLLYWTTVYWQQTRDPWLDQPSFRLAYNGDGMLLYPGVDAGFDGPVASIRLKTIREGMEDYEYFALLVQRGERAFVEQHVRSLARSWFDWEHDPQALYSARQRLAVRLERKP